jgi:4-hydroxyphenylacetate 3-monooxygenase
MSPDSATRAVTTTRPLTGQDYLDSLRDGREVWIYGERVKDVTTHPAFRNPARAELT